MRRIWTRMQYLPANKQIIWKELPLKSANTSIILTDCLLCENVVKGCQRHLHCCTECVNQVITSSRQTGEDAVAITSINMQLWYPVMALKWISNALKMLVAASIPQSKLKMDTRSNASVMVLTLVRPSILKKPSCHLAHFTQYNFIWLVIVLATFAKSQRGGKGLAFLTSHTKSLWT